MRSTIAVSLLVLMWASAPQAEAQSSTHPIIGNWVQSMVNAPQTAVHSYTVREDGFMVWNRATVSTQGVAGFIQVVLKSDGADYPIYQNATLANMSATGTPITFTGSFRLTDDALEMVTKNDGEPDGTIRTWTVSRDGQTLTQIARSTNDQGETAETETIYKRAQQ